MSTHDVAGLADDADHVTVLASGKICYDGTARDFLRQAPEGTPDSRRAQAANTALAHHAV